MIRPVHKLPIVANNLSKAKTLGFSSSSFRRRGRLASFAATAAGAASTASSSSAGAATSPYAPQMIRTHSSSYARASHMARVAS